MPTSTFADALVPGTALGALIRDCLRGAGLPGDDAEAVADVLVDANLRGEESHGFARVPVYMCHVHRGLARGTDGMRDVASFGATRRLDAAHALGPAAAVKAVDLAAALAAEHGIGLVAVGNSTHFGAAGFYARRLAAGGLLGIAASNGPANMAPHGAAEPFLGTNPLAIAAPLGRHGEFALDMSSSVVARGKIIRARAAGEPIAQGLAIDADGLPTEDAAAALAGAVLPAAGAKGSGLALAISLLAVMLAGADADADLAPMFGNSERQQNVGHLFIAIDPWQLSDRATVEPRLEDLFNRLHALRPAAGASDVRHPGQRGAELAAQRRRQGIPLAAVELEAVAGACSECGLVDMEERVRALASR